MLGRKQSIKENILADYGNEELTNESADVEWVNKVSSDLYFVFGDHVIVKYVYCFFTFSSGSVV